MLFLWPLISLKDFDVFAGLSLLLALKLAFGFGVAVGFGLTAGFGVACGFCEGFGVVTADGVFFAIVNVLESSPCNYQYLWPLR